MTHDFDRSLFEGNPHSPSLASIAAHMGCEQGELLDFCVPCNPYFPTEPIFERLAERVRLLTRYYPSDIEVIGKKLAGALGVDPEKLVVSNGSDELIAWLDELFATDGVCTPVPTFNRWVERPRSFGRPAHLHYLSPDDDFRFDAKAFVAHAKSCGASVAVIVNPNNPTGAYIPEDDIVHVLESLRELRAVIVDESFIDFVDAHAIPSSERFIDQFDNLVVLKSLGKNFGMHGLRLGYCMCNPERAALIRQALPRWTVNALAEALIEELGHTVTQYEAARRRVVRDREFLQSELESISGLKVYPSRTNFVTFCLPPYIQGRDFRDRLLTDHRIFVRECGNKDGLDSQFIRVASRPQADVVLLVSAIRTILASPEAPADEHRPAIAPSEPVLTLADRSCVRPADLADFELSLPVRPEWGAIDLLRRAVEETVQACVAPKDTESAVAMVVAELLEEAVATLTPRHEKRPEIQLVIRGRNGRAWVEVAAEVDEQGKADWVEDAVAWINRQPRAREAYGEALRQCCDGSSPLKLSLVRVAYEGNAEVSCDVADAGLIRLRVELDTMYA